MHHGDEGLWESQRRTGIGLHACEIFFFANKAEAACISLRGGEKLVLSTTRAQNRWRGAKRKEHTAT